MERVSLNLERLLPELRDLEKKKVFTRIEIAEIVKRRTAYETSLIRKGSNERDWLEYIDYEKKLEKLRKLRCSKMKLKGRPTVSDYSISRHILSLYSSSVTRVPGSTKLWQEYISHVLRTSNSSPEVSRVLARALTLHPTNPAIWLLAIRFEADGTASYARDEINTFEDDQPETTIGGGNIDAARKLAMRGIRFTKGAREEDARLLWVEWARLEVSFVERMRKRWEILGIKDAMNGQANLDVEEMEVDGTPTEESVEKAERQLEAVKESQGRNAVLEGGIARIVVQNAIAAFPGRTAIYTDLLSLLRPLPTPLRPTLLEEIYRTLRSNIPAFETPSQAAQARIILARRHLEDLAEPQKDGLSLKATPIDSVEWIEAVGGVVKDFQAATKDLPGNVELMEDFAVFLADCWQKTEDASLKQYLSAHILKLIKSANKQNIQSDKLLEAAQQCE